MQKMCDNNKGFRINGQTAMYGGKIVNIVLNGDRNIGITFSQDEQRSIYCENGCESIIDDNAFDAMLGYFLSDDKDIYKITVRNANGGEPIDGLTKAVKLLLTDFRKGSFLSGRIVDCYLKSEKGYKRYADMTIPFKDKCSDLDLRVKVVYCLLLIDRICNARREIDKDNKIKMRVFFSRDRNFGFYVYVDEAKLKLICEKSRTLNFDEIMQCINNDYATDFGEEFITDEILPYYFFWLGYMDDEKYKRTPDILKFDNFKFERVNEG